MRNVAGKSTLKPERQSAVLANTGLERARPWSIGAIRIHNPTAACRSHSMSQRQCSGDCSTGPRMGRAKRSFWADISQAADLDQINLIDNEFPVIIPIQFNKDFFYG